MAILAPVVVEFEADPGKLVQIARILQKHFGAMADDLENLRDSAPAEPRAEITEAGQ
jgi:hypothetical protein